ncbi:MAG: xanthine phosphoribosyltransferase [Erysipelotrichaceae bacterium]|nr:xanthine phosphoribosyltransferase [Erysipelotrichaceae bacterium]
MDALKKRILEDGKVLSGNVLKVDSFLNHRIDTEFILEIGKEFKKIFSDCEVDKILTIEASGIAVSFATAQSFNFCPVVFAKKGAASNMGNDVYHASLYSYTRRADFEIYVSKGYLNKGDKILIIDDFLANGEALNALIKICEQAGCELVGCGVVIEKAMQKGGEMIREKGIRVEALARIDSMDAEKGIEFC